MDTPHQAQDQDQDASAPAVKFRSTRTRKTLRQRPQDDHLQQQQQQQQHHHHRPETSPSSSPSHVVPPSDDAKPAPSSPSSVTAALRARIARRPRRLRGVAFSTDSQADDHAVRLPAADGAGDGGDEENRLAASKGIPDRFMHQTGLVSTLDDKHMVDYIESRLSSRAAPPPSSYSPDEHTHTLITPASSSSDQQRPRAVQPTRHGKIVEVDLTSQPLSDKDDPRKRKPNTTLPAAAPWRRNRRGSDDAKRDQLVEAFLRENKVGVFNLPGSRQPHTGGPRDGRSADDRMAEEFRRRFFDEMAARRLRRKPIPPTRQQRELREMRASEVLKGPKLGGSRNHRAAVRNILLKQEKEKLGRKT
ncbi:hypothetical protein E4U41_006821 [Claviceps citrina]|nr:hypothetical protein E4U41_006821 [Claviceps citrina]